MNVFSVFSGVGGMDLGLERAGMNTVAFCESDATARSVLKRHWPNVPIFNDICTTRGSDVRNVDILAGGSPCQNLSVAGDRQGLDGERSKLFWHQCRLADQGSVPWILWENVFGALTSSDGQDFASVLWGLTGTRPRVPNGGWRSWGVVVGPKRWAAWRVLDAQWYGVAQRRRRLFVVACSRADCRPDILFEEGNCGKHFAPTTTRRTQASETIDGGIRSDPASGLMVYGRASQGVYSLGVATLTASAGKRHEDNIVIPASFDPRKGIPLSDDDVNRVRRITALESERLMGWPDHWTASGHDGSEIPLTTRYRMCGNGVVSSVAQWVAERISCAEKGIEMPGPPMPL